MGGTIIMADLGKVGITYDENGYVAETTYEPLTVLKYTDGGTYMSIAPTLGHLPTDTNYWVTVVPPITASEIGYTPIAGGVITNTNMQGAIEQSDSLKVSTNKIANNLTTVDAGYVLDARQGKVLNDSLTGKLNGYNTSPATPFTDANDIDKTSCLYMAGTSSNIPQSGTSFVITTIASSVKMQIAQPYYGESVHDTYIRQYINGSWKAWVKMVGTAV
jgi:hypothetical protein